MSDNLLEDFSNTCRACSCKTQSFQQLNAKISNEHTWQVHEMLQLLMPQLSVQLNDALPQQICDLCVNKLEMIYEFQQMCIKSEQEFHQILQANVLKATDVLTVIKQEDPEFIDMQIDLKELSMHLNVTEEKDEVGEEGRATEEETNVFALPVKIVEKSEQNSKPFGCIECGKMFKTRQQVDQHKKLHSTGRPFACQVCSCRFTTKCHLSGHYNAEHPECEIFANSMQSSNQYSCTECGKQYNLKSCLTKHMRLHDKGRSFFCSFCSFRFTDQSYLTRHIKAEHAEDKKKAIEANGFECRKCNRRFKKQKSLNAHGYVHRNDTPKEPRVQDNKLVNEKLLKEHEDLHKSGVANPHKCDYCELEFLKMPMLQQHLRLQHPNENFLCTECGKICTKYISLKRHMLVHSTERPFKCKKCPQSFKDHSGLIKHKSVHREFSKHQCDICAKTFSRSDSLRFHKKKHLGIRPYQCELCDKSFISSSHLITHKQRHSGEKIHKCKYCSRAFVNSGDLLRHIRLHVDGYLYSCRVCNEKFKYQKEMRVHETTHFAQNEQTDEQQQQHQQSIEKKEKERRYSTSTQPVMPTNFHKNRTDRH